jgi:hypothetical protein
VVKLVKAAEYANSELISFTDRLLGCLQPLGDNGSPSGRPLAFLKPVPNAGVPYIAVAESWKRLV